MMINRPLAYIWKAWCLLYISLHVKKRRLFNSLQNFHGSFFATNLPKRKFCKVEKEVVKKEEKAAAFCRCRHKSRISNQLYISLIIFFFLFPKNWFHFGSSLLWMYVGTMCVFFTEPSMLYVQIWKRKDHARQTLFLWFLLSNFNSL